MNSATNLNTGRERRSSETRTVQDSPSEQNMKVDMPEKAPQPASAVPQQPALKKFTHNFFDPEVAHLRKIYLSTLAKITVAITLLIWTALPIYWGSQYHTTEHKGHYEKLDVLIADYDNNSPISQIVFQTFASASQGIATPSYVNLPYEEAIARYPGGPQDLADGVVDHDAWAAVVSSSLTLFSCWFSANNEKKVNPGAYASLQNALNGSNTTYEASSALTFYGVEARNNMVYGPILSAVQKPLTQACVIFAAQTVRASAANSATSPQLLVQPIFYTINNLRPYDISIATALLLVGLILLLIVAFIFTMANYGIRQVIAPYLNLRSLVLVRLALPPVLYFIPSLWVSLVSYAFQVPFDRKFGDSGFLVFWAVNYCAMLALGLATEAMITLTTPQFIAFFLIFWIVSNVSVAGVPPEIQYRLYHYGFAMPFYNASNAIRTILFSTKNQVGQNIGILLVWAFVSCITIPLFQAFMRRFEVRNAKVLEREEKGELVDGED
ncbi:hypothetical protein BT69DRAFT_1316579 [Atractiella rhizophila]|nr:hypothetical protein BT69DRAFT_1316579 [Atractiella rhizophila]